MCSLIIPTADHLTSYVSALERGWSPDNLNVHAGRDQLLRIQLDPVGFVASFIDREARGGPVVLPDGTAMPRLPGIRLWIWDGEFCGSIGFRWQPGTEELPPHVLGHIGYAVVPWKQGKGIATNALKSILPYARAEGLRWVDLTTDPENIASQRTILKNGGVLLREFVRPSFYGQSNALLFRISLLST